MKNISGNDIKIIGVGIAVAITVSVLLVILESWLVVYGHLSLTATRYLVIVINLMAMLVSGLLARIINKNMRMLHLLIIAAGYILAVLCANILVYSEGVYNFIYTIIGVVAGVGVNLLRFLQQRPSKG